MKKTYGALVRRLYDHLFSSSFSSCRWKINKSLEDLARAKNGQIYHDAYSELFPKIQFSRETFDYHFVVTPGYDGLDSFRVAFIYASHDERFRKHPFPHLTVYSKSIMKSQFTNPNLKELSSSDEVFASRFIANCPEIISIDEAIDVRSREQLFKLYYLYSRNDLFFTSQGGRAMVRKEVDSSILTHPDTLMRFLDGGDDFFHALSRSHFGTFAGDEPSRWIKYLSVSTETARCKICGEFIYFSKVHCKNCDTPHHIDCWQYNGSCSVYGCGSTEYYYPML